MPSFKINPAKSIHGEIELPADKSIAHRSIFISAIAKGKTQIYNYPTSDDCLTTLRVFRKLGVRISKVDSCPTGINLCVEGRGLYGLKKPSSALFTRDSGTTFRLLLGLLSGQPFRVVLTAGPSLCLRPMRRVTEPLRRMGAVIKARQAYHPVYGKLEEYPPITIKGGSLCGINYKMPIASAQVKSALLLAGLYAEGKTQIFEPSKTRDHTERMLKDFGADIKINRKIISITGKKKLVSCGEIHIPGDISSASFFITAAILLPNSQLVIKSVGLNPGRIGIIRVLKRMGANIKVIPIKSSAFGSEPVGDLVVTSSRLSGVEIKSREVPQMIDELPVLMLASCLAQGRTLIYGAEELRVKETDRISSMLINLKRMGANIYVISQAKKSGRPKETIVIQGKARLKGAKVSSFGDHRTAMTMIIAGLVSEGVTTIYGIECIAKSFPDFLKVLKKIVR